MAKESKNKVSRFGVSEYEGAVEDEELLSVEHMRSYFLQSVSELVPEVLDELESELLPLYRVISLFCYEADEKRREESDVRIRATWRDHNRPTWEYVENAWINRSPDKSFVVQFDEYYSFYDEDDTWNVPFFRTPAHKDPNIAAFIEKMFDWSRRHNLDAVWCRARAYETLDFWCYDQSYLERRIWKYEPLDLLPFALHPITLSKYDSMEFIFKFLTLYPSVGYRPDVEREITEDFKAQLKFFLDGREKIASKAGMSPTPNKREMSHFIWLAQFQVKEMSYREISNEVDPPRGSAKAPYLSDDTKKVRKAVNDLARAIKLPLRAEGRRPGRRPKKS